MNKENTGVRVCVPLVTTRMDREGLMLSAKDKYRMISAIYENLLKIFLSRTLIDTENGLVLARGRGWGVGT